ncbi:MAG: hypothetical protein R2878_04385 [Thermoleophilia bacterium]
MNTQTLPLPIKYLGGLIFVLVLGLVIYIAAALHVYILAWVIELIAWIFG